MNPRVLYITAHLPHGRACGSQLRTLHVARALQQFGDVRLLLVGIEGAEQEAIQATLNEFQVESLVRLERAPAVSPSQRVRDLADPRRMNLYGFVADQSAKRKLAEKLGEFDLVWLHHLSVSYLFDRWNWPRSVMDIDDVPSTFERTIWQSSTRLMERVKALWRMYAWRSREKLLAERFSVLGVCSQADRDYLRSTAPVHVIPNGFEKPFGEPRRKPSIPARIGFIGLMGYRPNLEGVRWFVRECWPAIKRELPNARLRLVGKGSDDPNNVQGVDIDALGWLEDPAEEIATWSASIVPVQSGAGTRIKVAEAFSRKCPLVSTRVGAFGYEVADGKELLLADNPDAFAAACVRLVRNPSEATAMAERSWGRFLNEWTWDAITPRVWAAADECLRLRGRTPLPRGGAVHLA